MYKRIKNDEEAEAFLNEAHQKFSDNIRKIAEERHITINGMEDICGLSFGQISKRINGHQALTVYLLMKVSRGLGVTIDSLISDG